MKLTVILDPAADKDIEDEFNYLADRNIDVALRFLKAADNTCETLAEMPGMGSPRIFKNSQLEGMRMWLDAILLVNGKFRFRVVIRQWSAAAGS